MNGSQSFVAEMRSEPLDARSDGSEVHNMTTPTRCPADMCGKKILDETNQIEIKKSNDFREREVARNPLKQSTQIT
ncbi:hypothetical protein RHMOL_Rhmol09G0175600 [Rhododendron molle]|nr:hypothetical protein RHMOL_Rhmol09G0175600 [Rhododendron molle]